MDDTAHRTERVTAAMIDLLAEIWSNPDLVEKMEWWVDDDTHPDATVYKVWVTLRHENR